jgi:L-rhamnose mutarotase
MIMETTPEFSFTQKQAKDAANPTVQQWETLMSNYQQALPCAKPGEKWVLMEQIFKL